MADIPRAEWGEYLESFSMQHHGWLVDLQIVEPDGAVAAFAHNLALHSVELAEPGQPAGQMPA